MVIGSEIVEHVQSFKYPVLDSSLCFYESTSIISRKVYLLRQQKNFGDDNPILELVCHSLIKSILTFNLYVWFNILSTITFDEGGQDY